MFTIVDWNINPNREWHVKIEDNGADMLVGLYLSEANAKADLDRVAYGTGSFGTASAVTLTMEESGSPTISLVNPALSYHLKVSGADADETKYYKLHPFTDLPEINNSVYRSENLILRRITREINAHTHVAHEKTVSMATLIDNLAINDVLQINSAHRGITSDNIVEEISINGSTRSLLSTVIATEYLDFTKG